MAGSRKIRLLEAATWLGRGLDEEALKAARASVVVPASRHQVGPWEWLGSPCAVGLLILDGRVARGLRVEGTTSHGIEMLGSGDLLRPWTFEGGSSSFPASEDWNVLSALECAVLDLDYVKATLRWPRIGINLLDSAIERSRSLSYLLTARQAPRLEARILLTLWHLADRWGRVYADGVVLDLPKLTHEMIANMIAARRPSVTTGLRHLRDLGLVEVQSRGRWLLRGDPASALELVTGEATAPRDEAEPAGLPTVARKLADQPDESGVTAAS
jgi:CRP/FNR family transcriptional regulator, cyclic AMP receptor protein